MILLATLPLGEESLLRLDLGQRAGDERGKKQDPGGIIRLCRSIRAAPRHSHRIQLHMTLNLFLTYPLTWARPTSL